MIRAGFVLVLLQVAILSGCASTSRQGQPYSSTSEQMTYGPKPEEPYGPAPYVSRPISLVLANAVVRGLAHAGVIRALHAIKVPIGTIYATGMGALVGTQYCMKSSVNQMEWGLQKINESSFSRFSGEVKESVVEELSRGRLLEQCRTPTIIAVESEAGRVEMRGSGSVLEAVLSALNTPAERTDQMATLIRNAGPGKLLVVELSGGPDLSEDGDTLYLRPDLRDVLDNDSAAKPRAIYAGELAVRKNSERIKEWFKNQ